MQHQFINQIIRIPVFSNDALHYAARHDEPELCDLLLSFGSHVNTASIKSSDTPLHDAILYRSLSAAHYLIDQGADVNHRTTHQDSPLHKAVTIDDLGLTKRLLEKGAIIHHQNQSGNTPLAVALRIGNINMIHMLFEHYESLNLPDEQSFLASEGETTLAAYEQWNLQRAVNQANLNTPKGPEEESHEGSASNFTRIKRKALRV